MSQICVELPETSIMLNHHQGVIYITWTKSSRKFTL